MIKLELNTIAKGSQVINEREVTIKIVFERCLLRIWLLSESLGSLFVEKNQIIEYTTTMAIRQTHI